MAYHRAHHATAQRNGSALLKVPVWKTFSWWATGLLLVGLVVAVTMRFTELEKLTRVLKDVNIWWALLGVIAQAFSYACAARVWQLAVRAGQGPHIPFLSLFLLSIGQVFAREAVPSGGVSGNLLVLKGFMNRGVLEKTGAASLLVNLISFHMGYATAVILAMGIFAAHERLPDRFITVGLIVLCIAVAVPSTAIMLWRRQMHRPIPKFLRRWNFAREILNKVRDSPPDVLGDRRALAEAALLQLGVFIADALTLYVALQAFGHPLPPEIVFAAHVMSNAMTTVAPTPLGLGSYEGTCIYLLHRLGAPVETALAATLLFRFYTVWMPILPGFFVARHEVRGGRAR